MRPVGVGLMSRGPIGVDGLTVTTGNLSSAARRRTAPFAHGGNEERRHVIARVAVDAVEQIVQRAAGPECFLEFMGVAAQPAHAQRLFEDDRPGPERGEQEDDQDELDHDVGLKEQAPDGQVVIDRPL